jgi:hypothetical protein
MSLSRRSSNRWSGIRATAAERLSRATESRPTSPTCAIWERSNLQGTMESSPALDGLRTDSTWHPQGKTITFSYGEIAGESIWFWWADRREVRLYTDGFGGGAINRRGDNAHPPRPPWRAVHHAEHRFANFEYRIKIVTYLWKRRHKRSLPKR